MDGKERKGRGGGGKEWVQPNEFHSVGRVTAGVEGKGERALRQATSHNQAMK